MVKNPSTYQTLFFELVRDRIKDNEMLVDILSELLNCSKDSAYRRIRGTTELSLNDSIKIANHFGIPLSQLSTQHNQSIVFQKSSFINSIDDFQNYLLQSLGQLQHIQQYEHHRLIYQAKDLPIYYQFRFPKLAAFKIYVWLKSVYGIDYFEGMSFNPQFIPKELLKLAKELWEAYSKINSVEIWNDTTILSMVNQLEYYYDAGLLSSKEEAVQICDEFQEMMKMIYKQALSGKKVHHSNSEELSDASYEMYYHEILIMDNHILAELDNNQSIYFVPYAGLNYLNTKDPSLNLKMKEYLVGQTKKSSLISNISEKERNKFFIRIKNRIDQLKNRIEASNPFM